MIFDAKNLIGPVYDIDRKHMYTEIDKKIEGLKSLHGPTYDGIQRDHSYFGSLEIKLALLKDLTSPIYDIEREHHFVNLGQKLESLKEMSYPVRENVDYSHHFNEIQNKVVVLRSLTGNTNVVLQEAFIFKKCAQICTQNS
jgi:hypothetical protein